MADYGSKKYYEDEIQNYETKLHLMLKGFSAIVEEDKYADMESFIPYIDQLASVANSLQYNKRRVQEILDEEANSLINGDEQ